jgi:hypothetical protein
MTRHVTLVRECTSTNRRELKLDQALRWDDHSLESVWAELREPITGHVEAGAEKKVFGHNCVKFRIVVPEL